MNSLPTGQTSLSVLLDKIEERANKATPGPWGRAEEDSRVLTYNDPEYSRPMSLLGLNEDDLAIVFEETDADFLFAARTDVPALVKALRRAVEEVQLTAYAPEEVFAEITALLNEGRTTEEVPSVPKGRKSANVSY